MFSAIEQGIQPIIIERLASDVCTVVSDICSSVQLYVCYTLLLEYLTGSDVLDQMLSNKQTPAMTHLDAFSLVFKLNVHTKVGPRLRVLYTGHS